MKKNWILKPKPNVGIFYPINSILFAKIPIGLDLIGLSLFKTIQEKKAIICFKSESLYLFHGRYLVDLKTENLKILKSHSHRLSVGLVDFYITSTYILAIG